MWWRFDDVCVFYRDGSGNVSAFEAGAGDFRPWGRGVDYAHSIAGRLSRRCYVCRVVDEYIIIAVVKEESCRIGVVVRRVVYKPVMVRIVKVESVVAMSIGGIVSEVVIICRIDVEAVVGVVVCQVIFQRIIMGICMEAETVFQVIIRGIVE